MPLSKFLEKAKKFEIQSYSEPLGIDDLARTHVAFSGSPRMHPHEDDKVILIADPFSTHTSYMEFRAKDISYIEEMPKIVNVEGEVISMVRIWVKKMSIGVRFTPFIVEDLR